MHREKDVLAPVKDHEQIVSRPRRAFHHGLLYRSRRRAKTARERGGSPRNPRISKPVEKRVSVHDLSFHAQMPDTPSGRVDANLRALRTLIRGREKKHFKLVCAKRVGYAAALTEVVGEVVQGGRIADSDSHEGRLGTLAAWR